jgi:hypothetical protein
MRAGSTSHNAIAAKLNERNVRTKVSRIRLSDKTSRLHPRHVVPKPAQAHARGGTWTHVQVGAILRPFEASAGFAVP